MASKKAVGKVASKSDKQTVEDGVQTLQNEITEFAEKVKALSVNASYVPKGWVDGEVIYDEDLNHIEQGIASLADAANDLQSQADDLQNAIDEINTDLDVKTLSSSISYNSTYWSPTVYCYQSGKVVSFYIYGTLDFSALPTTNTWASVASGFPAPPSSIAVNISLMSGNTTTIGIVAQINTSGNIQVNKSAASTTSSIWVQVFGCYITA